jgi:hypothetical protein
VILVNENVADLAAFFITRTWGGHRLIKRQMNGQPIPGELLLMGLTL